MEQVGAMAETLVSNWRYFIDGCIGGVFLELAVLGGFSRLNRAPISNPGLLAVYSVGCILGGGLYASRFLAASSDYAAMVGGFTFPITLGSIAGKVPESHSIQPQRRGDQRKQARQALRQRVENS